MQQSQGAQVPQRIRRWIVWGVPLLFVLGGLTHFVYDWSGQQIWISVLAPVNESVWEHLKMAYWPVMVWWALGYVLYRQEGIVSSVQWITAAAVSVLIGPAFIVSFYYTYTGAFGVHFLPLDILSLLAGLALSQVAALHILRYATLRNTWFCVSMGIIALLGFAFFQFTFYPPHIPLFMDISTGQYGI